MSNSEVYVHGRRASIEQGRVFVVHSALMFGMDHEEVESLYQKSFSDSIDGKYARDELVDFGVEIVLGD